MRGFESEFALHLMNEGKSAIASDQRSSIHQSRGVALQLPTDGVLAKNPQLRESHTIRLDREIDYCIALPRFLNLTVTAMRPVGGVFNRTCADMFKSM